MDPVEHEDRWLLNLRGLKVTRISVDLQLTLTIGSDWHVVLETSAHLSHGPGRNDSPVFRLVPESQDVAPALPLFGAKVLSAVAFKSGTLRLMFDNGVQLRCSADPSFEAWQIAGPRRWRFVSLPGNDLAVWRPEPANTPIRPKPEM